MSDTTVEAIVGTIGEKIELCRKETGITLNELARRAGVSPAAIHKIEKKEMIPSITVLMKIARALNKGVGFFTQEAQNGFNFRERLEVVRKESRKTLTSPSGARMEVLAMCLEGGQMEGCIFHFGPGAKSGVRPDAHKGEELFLVLQGEMTFVVNDEPYVLKQGDSIHLLSENPHQWDNSGGTDLEMLWVMTPLPLSSLERWIP